MNSLILGRAFIGMTMAFHIAFALFGVGIPLLICIIELIGIVRKDSRMITLAKQYTFAMTVFFIVGAISGTVISVAFAVLLSPLMAVANKVIILPFVIEGFAFLLEATFLGLYAYTWDRFENPWKHWLLSVPIVLASGATAFLITTVNAWMNTPIGFTYSNGVFSNINQWHAMTSPAVIPETTHSIMAYYATTAFVFAAITAYQLINEGKKERFGQSYQFKKKIVALLLGIACVFSIGVAITGDSSARFIAHYEPEKLAAAEGIIQTTPNAPFVVFGKFNDQDHDDLQGGIRVPELLSFLVGGSKNIVIRGLADFNPDTWPPLIVHYFFDGMAIIGMLMLITPFLYFIFYKWHHVWIFGKPMEWLIIITGIGSIIAVELGWMLTEIGRQPYVIAGIMTSDAAYNPNHMNIIYACWFPIVYIILSLVTYRILTRHYRTRI